MFPCPSDFNAVETIFARSGPSLPAQELARSGFSSPVLGASRPFGCKGMTSTGIKRKGTKVK